MGNWNTENSIRYVNVRIMKDAKHLPASGEKRGVTFLTICHQTKGGEDKWINGRVEYNAELYGNLRKGDIATITGELRFQTNKKTNKEELVLYITKIETLVKLKDRATATEETAGSGGAEPAADETDDGMSAFD